jgi:hypothetical protein
MATNSGKIRPLWFIAALLAWIVPGAGHVYLGRTLRGVILFVAIGATFWAGVAVGGVMTIDSRYDRWWFCAQSLCGVHSLIGWYRQEQVYKEVAKELGKKRIEVPPGGRPTDEQMRVDEKLQAGGIVVANSSENVARAYSGIAGLLNLLCVFDVVLLALMGRAGEPKRNSAPTVRKEAATS